MSSVIHIGLDVHKDSFTAAALDAESRDFIAVEKLKPTAKAVLAFGQKISGIFPEATLEYGYEAGCTGFVLARELAETGNVCHILAPSSMPVAPGSSRKKNDRRDAGRIAQCLANRTYAEVQMPAQEDEDTRDYIRMRDDCKAALAKFKQQILSFCLRHNLVFSGTKSNWTAKHVEWLRTVEMSEMQRATLDGYLREYERLVESIERMDGRITEIAATERYREPVHKLMCIKGIAEHTALALVCEIGDFRRFASAGEFTSFLGLVPSEHSSGNTIAHGSITKTGNTHLRKLAVEAAQGYTRGAAGYKSKALRMRQEGVSAEIIDYADRCSTRLKRKYERMIHQGKPHNVAKTAVARELMCFVWGMMTGNTGPAEHTRRSA